MELGEVLGYINEFVEHDDSKVIVLANVDELPKDNSFDRRREKLIGKTLLIKPSFDAAFKSFLKLISDAATERWLKNSQNEIAGIYFQSQLNNFRILLQTMWDFERLYQALDAEQRANEVAIRALLSLFFAYSLEFKAGNIDADQIYNRPTSMDMAIARASGGDTGIADGFAQKYNLRSSKISAEKESMPHKAQVLLSDMIAQPDQFFRRINATSDGEPNDYYNVPILNFIDPALFVDGVLSLPSWAQRQIFIALGGRYESIDWGGKLKDERAWLEEVDAEIEKARARLAGIDAYRLGKLREWYITTSLTGVDDSNG